MATVSTLPSVKSKLVTLLTTATATAGTGGGQVQVSYAWPGAATVHESIYLGRLPFDGVLPPSETITDLIPTIKAGRKQRQEEYTIPVTIHSFRPDLAVSAAATAEAQGFVLLGKLEDVLADDPTLGLSSIHWARLADVEIVGGAPLPWEQGWLCLLIADVIVRARLT